MSPRRLSREKKDLRKATSLRHIRGIFPSREYKEGASAEPLSVFWRDLRENAGGPFPMSNCGLQPARRYSYEDLPAYSPERVISGGALRNPRVAKILAILREVEAQPRNWTKGRTPGRSTLRPCIRSSRNQSTAGFRSSTSAASPAWSTAKQTPENQRHGRPRRLTTGSVSACCPPIGRSMCAPFT